jgi:predicted flap endonuclease-1-like 5' DNA nuclease
MADRFTADLLFIIIVLLIAALLGYLIGYFLARARYRKKIDALEEEKAALLAQVSKLEEEKLTLQTDVRRMDDVIASLKLTIEKLEKEARVLAEQAGHKAARATGARVVTDDLKAVLGIGSKISKILMNRGINTWKALAETSPDTLREYLIQDGGERFRINNPDSWPEQARLLHEGKFDELKELQSKIQP